VERQIRAGGNGDLEATSHDWTQNHKEWALASLEKLRQPEFCGGCHQQFVPGTGLVAIGTLDEYHQGPYAGRMLCVDCHMPKDGHGLADHRAAGGNFYLGQKYGDATLQMEQQQHLASVLTVTPARVAGGVLVTLRNTGAAHAFPTGVTDIRQPWVEVQAKDASGKMVARWGGPGADGLVPQDAPRLGIDIAADDGTLLLRHELSAATRIPFDVRVPPGEAQALFVPLDPAPPAGATLDAVVMYGVLRASYWRAAVGDPGATAPAMEIARVAVP
jgi:hypothetical protein